MNETSLALNAALGMNHNPTSHLNTNTTSSSSNNAVGGPSSHLPSHLPSTSSSSGPSSSILPSSTSMNMAGPSSRDPGLGSSSTSNSALASGSGSGSGPGPSGMALGIPTGMNNQQQQLLNAAAQRKQNIACDGCRSRKVKCVRQPGSERCDHCRAKKTSCTSHYVTSLSTVRRKPTSLHANGNGNGIGNGGGGGGSGTTSSDEIAYGASGSAHPSGMDDGRGRMGLNGDSSSMDHKRSKRRRSSPHELSPSASRAPYLAFASDTNATHTEQLSALLAYLFSARPVVGLTGKWRDPTQAEMADGMPYSPTFWDKPSQAHLKLNTDESRRDLASDLVETYFQIVHIRLPLLDPGLFRRKFHNPDGPDGPPFLPIVACVLAWGAKFSEHSVIHRDRDECSIGLLGERRRSRLIQMVAVRAQQVAEICKVYRVPSLENVQACLMLNVLEGGNINVPNDFVGMWGKVACTHLVNLRYHKREVLQAMDSKRRASIAFTFWMTCWTDGSFAAFFGYKPQLLEGDWDVEPEQAWSAASESSLNPMSRLEDVSWAALTVIPYRSAYTRPLPLQFLLWSDSNTGLCRVSRSMATYLWQPGNETQGIPLVKIKQTVKLLADWQDQYLTRVGVPTVWPETWDFMAAVTACTEDADYHIHWTRLASAIQRCGIKELKRPGESSSLVREEAETVKSRIEREAMEGALRIAALAGVLTQNSYLRLDPNVLFAALYRSGAYLAEAGRIECMKCIAGLRQYGLCFEEAFDRADELELIYQGASNHSLLSTNIPITIPGTTTLGGSSRHTLTKPHQPANYPFPPNLGQMTLPASNDFSNYGVSAEMNNPTVSHEFYGLADQHSMNQMFYNDR